MSSEDRDLFGPRPPAQPPKKKASSHTPVVGKVWTEQKSALIAEYLHRFLLVTRSGVYIDLFAGPQSEHYGGGWSIKQVIEKRDEGPTFKHFAACDNDPEQIKRLEALKCEHSERAFTFKIYYDDANRAVYDILREAPIKENTPCFCLIDQRTLECDWATVRALAEYRKEGYKIELFYFLAEGWMDRTWISTTRPGKLERWWGRDDYGAFFTLRNVYRAHALVRRFREELGYAYVEPWSIQQKGEGGRTMYYMIHASDHQDATRLMAEAHRITRRGRFESMKPQGLFNELASDGLEPLASKSGRGEVPDEESKD
jgi:three-Cys-motif partner protein